MLPEKQKTLAIPSKAFNLQTALYLFAVVAFLYGLLFKPPFLPLTPKSTADCFLYLAPGQRMYQGEMIYRDFFEFVTPGTALVHLFLFKLFGLRLWIPDLLVILLGLVLAWLSVGIARKLMHPRLALLPGAIFLVKVRTNLCDPVHHWFSLLAATAALAVIMERRTFARIAAAGFLCGLGACFTQTRGVIVVLGFALFLCWESRHILEGWRIWLKKEMVLLGSFLVTVLAVNAYFIWQAGPARFLWCTVTYVLKYYPKEADWNTFPVMIYDFPSLAISGREFYTSLASWLFLFVGIPSIFVLFFVRYFRQSRKTPLEYWQCPMLVAIVGLSVLMGIAPSPSSTRMETCALPPLLLLCWLLDSPRKLARILATLLAVGAPLVALAAVATRQLSPVVVLTTPQGSVGLIDPTRDQAFEEYSWIQQHTRPADYLYQADFSEIYFFLDLRNPTPLPRITNNGYTTTGQVLDVIRGLEQHQVRYILWRPEQLDELPDWENPSDAHLGPIRNYMQSNYKLIKTFTSSDQIWELKKFADVP